MGAMRHNAYQGYAHFDVGLGTPQVGVIRFDVRTIEGVEFVEDFYGRMQQRTPEFVDTPEAAWAAVAEKLDAVATKLRDKAATIRAEKVTVLA